MPPHRVILIFLKYPEPGRVKSRLGRTLGNAEAAAIYRELVNQVLEIVALSPADEVRIHFDPPGSEPAIRDWLSHLPPEWKLLPQTPGDLGNRLAEGFHTAFADGATAVIAIGTDCVEITTTTFQEAWHHLSQTHPSTVFGPTFDGGYYLIGLNHPCKAVFTDIPWSAENTLEKSIAAAQSTHTNISLLDKLNDIDDETDLKAARKRGIVI